MESNNELQPQQQPQKSQQQHQPQQPQQQQPQPQPQQQRQQQQQAEGCGTKFCANLISFFKKFDLYPYLVVLRNQDESEHSTLEGVLVSLTQIVLFAILFVNLLRQNFQQQIFIGQSYSAMETDPSKCQMSISSTQNKTMFAIGLKGIDLSSSQRYFDISLSQIETQLTNNQTSTPLYLESCTIQHWDGINENITKKFDKLNFNQWLCPKIGTVLKLQGKQTSDIFRHALIQVKKCTENNPFFPGTTCFNSSEVDALISSNELLTFSFYTTNPYIREGEEKYISYDIEDSVNLKFDTKNGVEANLLYSEYQIKAEHSFLPSISIFQSFNNPIQLKGLMSKEKAYPQNFILASSSNEYLTFKIQKHPTKYYYIHNYKKIDQVLSQFGGLFGFVTLILSIFFKVYSRYHFEIETANKLCFRDDGSSFLDGWYEFNFFTFLLLVAYQFFTKIFCCNCKTGQSDQKKQQKNNTENSIKEQAISCEYFWCKLCNYFWCKFDQTSNIWCFCCCRGGVLKKFSECRQEAEKQLNVCYLFDRLKVLKRGLEIIGTSTQNVRAYVSMMPTIGEMQRQRNIFQQIRRKKELKDNQQLRQYLNQNKGNLRGSMEESGVNMNQKEQKINQTPQKKYKKLSHYTEVQRIIQKYPQSPETTEFQKKFQEEKQTLIEKKKQGEKRQFS